MDSEVKNYEIAYLISPDVAEEDVFGEAGKITGFVQDARGLVGHIEEPKRRRLAYLVGKHSQAYFGWTSFSLPPGRLGDFKKRMAAEKNIARFTVSGEVKKPLPYIRSVRPARTLPINLEEVKPFEPQAPKEEDKVKIEELDKRLEEILGK